MEWYEQMDSLCTDEKDMSDVLRDFICLGLNPVKSMGAEPRRAGSHKSTPSHDGIGVSVASVVPSAEMPTAPKPKSGKPHQWTYGHAACYEVDLAHKDHKECCYCKPGAK